MSAVPEAPERPPRVGLRVLRRGLLGAVLIVLAAAATVAVAIRLEVEESVRIFQQASRPLSRSVDSALDDVKPGKPQTILLLGSDKRYLDVVEGNPARSDTIMLVRLDPQKGATAVMSVPRDLLVDIPGHGRDKVNAAFEEGGPQLTVKTLRQLLGISINHVVIVRFGAFARAVDELGCVYVDVDRKYFNDNNPPAGGGVERYAAIDIPAGYQKLCGVDALAFVRFRHLDNDFVRAARQQEFLSQAKQQIGVARLFNDRERLLRIFGRYTQTDRRLHDRDQILRIARLTFEATQLPIQEVPFRAYIDPENLGYVLASEQGIQRSVREFMSVKSDSAGRPTRSDEKASTPRATKRKHTKRRADQLAAGLVHDGKEGEQHVLAMSARAKLPVYYPTVRVATGSYQSYSPRLYTIRDRARFRYSAYRIVLSVDPAKPGQYWGVQGTTWMSPPILDGPYDEQRMAHRTYRVYWDGNRISRIAWRTTHAVYWVANSLNRELTNAQMRDIARSLTRVGA